MALLQSSGNLQGPISAAVAVGLDFFCLWPRFWAWDPSPGGQQVLCKFSWRNGGDVCCGTRACLFGFFQSWPFSHVWAQSPQTLYLCKVSTCSKVHKACIEPGIYLHMTFCCIRDLVFSWLWIVTPFYHGCMNKALILRLGTVGCFWQEGTLVLKPISAIPILLFLF